MACCRIDSMHTGEVRGTIKDVRNISTYLTFPARSPTLPQAAIRPWPRAILFLSEVYGPHLINSQLLADALARELNCPVIAPDMFDGAGFPFVKPSGWDGEKALERFQGRHHPGTVDPILDQILDWIQAPEADGGFGGVNYLGGVGYCFGGRYVIRLLAAGKIDVGVVNHPSFFTMSEVESLTQPGPTTRFAGVGWRPLAIFAAEEDDYFPEWKRRSMEDALKRMGTTWWLSTFSGTEHGFSVRGDLRQRSVRFARDAALHGAVSWFEEHLGNSM